MMPRSSAPPRTPWWARLRPWAAALRMARRDAARHRMRTLLATVLVALPITVLVSGTVLTQSEVPAREAALARIPAGAQAVITTTAIPRTGAPFPQLPEGPPGPWIDDFSQVPASGAELAARLPAGNRLLPYWDSPELLVTSELRLAPGEQTTAGAGAETLAQLDLARVSVGRLQEAGSAALALLVPGLATGHLPADSTEVVVTTALADRLGVGIGDSIAFIAPPHTGWYSPTGGRLGEVVQNTQRAYRISGVVEADTPQAWALAGWISELVAADPAGVTGHWLMVGEAPVTWDHVRAINHLQAFALSRHVLENYPAPDELYPVATDPLVLLYRLAAIVIAGTVGAVLVLFLVTPAFSVSIEQSRRTLGLAAVTGATPTDLRRIVTTQGLVVGLAGGLLGAAAGAGIGVVAYRAWSPEAAMRFPWWILPVAVSLAGLLGWLATLPPAAAASRLAPIDAIKDRATHPHRARSGSRRRRDALIGALLLVAAIVCARLSLWLPLPGTEGGGAEVVGGVLPLALLMTLLLTAGGIVLFLRSLPELLRVLARRLPAAGRLALRDAAHHRSRFLPAATAVLVTVTAASFFAVLVGSWVANERDRVGHMVGDGRIVLGARVPVSDTFDRRVLTAAVDVLAQELPVTGHEPVFSIPRGSEVYLAALPPEGRSCPEGTYPDTASSVEIGAPLRCVAWERAYAPGLSLPWWGGTDVHVLAGDALRASGLAGAEQAAAVLDRGGVVVNNAALLADDGTVRVAISREPLPQEAEAERIVTLPGAFIRGFAPPLALSPDTARMLGVTELEYVGEYVVTAVGLSQPELTRAHALLNEHTTLVVIGQSGSAYPWGSMGMLVPVVLLVAVAVAATTISVALARTQVLRDFATMHAVGATPRVLRRFTVIQAAVALAAGVPLGMLSGLALGAYLIAWNRRFGLDGAWLTTEPLWPVQAALAVGVTVAGLVGALAVARPPRRLVRRALD